MKVISKSKALKLDGGLTKQEVTVADATGVITVNLWEEKIDLLDLSESYNYHNF